ncbi:MULTISPECIES: aminotransferase class III-fold pyridoxal phosphate-dependent enzyme, partial [unclassified Burkholderia]
TSGYVPMGAVGIHERVARPIIDNGEFNHGLTYSGHPVAAAVAVANLKLLRDEGIVERVKHDIGPYFQRRLREALGDHPIVGEIAGAGLVAGVQLARDRARRERFDAGAD